MLSFLSYHLWTDLTSIRVSCVAMLVLLLVGTRPVQSTVAIKTSPIQSSLPLHWTMSLAVAVQSIERQTILATSRNASDSLAIIQAQVYTTLIREPCYRLVEEEYWDGTIGRDAL